MASAQPSEIKDEQRIQASYFESFVANNSTRISSLRNGFCVITYLKGQIGCQFDEWTLLGAKY